MKWPKHITIIRHGQSEYNLLHDRKRKDPDYQRFKIAYEADYQSIPTRDWARSMRERYVLPYSDDKTPLTELGMEQARLTAKNISTQIAPPDVIIHSPYLRVVQTLQEMKTGWPDLAKVPAVSDDRIREQEHGLALLYNDWRIFHVCHPEQKRLLDLVGPYWYRYPQGESAAEVCGQRIGQMFDMLIREYAGKDVWLIAHHLTILEARVKMERLSPEEFIRLDEEEKPVNCGVTRYACNPELGKDGKMELEFYNRSFC